MRHPLRSGWRPGVASGLVWECSSVAVTRGAAARFVVAALSLVLLLAAAGPQREALSEAGVSVIVREHASAGETPEHAVAAAGGVVERRIGLIDAFVARVPAAAVDELRSVSGVASVTFNRPVRLHGGYLDGWDHEHDFGSMYYVAQEVSGAGEYWNNRITGKGVDVALIDSGVVPVNGLRTPGKVVHGPDLSFESQSPSHRYLDTFGHGTHMAGIIAGRDDATPGIVQKGEGSFVGMAPDARIVSVKVADAQGYTDVSQVLAAIDWVVQHRKSDGLNIRVLNLSFGTDGEQDYRLDPLAFAVEMAWRKGIAVVVAAGNGGFGSAKLNNPAYDPFVIAVGGADGHGTYNWLDDTVPTWSSYGDGTRNPDLVAPGKSVVSLRVPGSHLDLAHPGGRVGKSRFFRGSGTSQAAAVVSGAAALIIQQRPAITPDELKAFLVKYAQRLPVASTRGQGAGMLNLKLARDMATPKSNQTWQPATGKGLLELARGSGHLDWGGVKLKGEKDIFGAPFESSTWATRSSGDAAWTGGSWNGNAWTGNAWSGNAWTGNAWTGNAWSGNAWTGNAWSGNAWTGNAWSGNVWTGNAWSGNAWTGNAWSGNAWSGNAWSSSGWGK